MAGQQGKCAVTNEPLTVKSMECHHIIPKQYGGTDEYKNLMWVSTNVHKLIHATEQETINKYLEILNALNAKQALRFNVLDTKILKKVNSLRKKTKNLDTIQVN